MIFIKKTGVYIENKQPTTYNLNGLREYASRYDSYEIYYEIEDVQKIHRIVCGRDGCQTSYAIRSDGHESLRFSSLIT